MRPKSRIGEDDDTKEYLRRRQSVQVVSKSLSLRRHHCNALRAADAVLMWVLYGAMFGPAAVPFLARDCGLLLDSPQVVRYDVVADIRTAFLRLAQEGPLAELPERMERWVMEEFSSDLPTGVPLCLTPVKQCSPGGPARTAAERVVLVIVGLSA